MKITRVISLEIPDVKVIQFSKFADDRGYFTEIFRASDLLNHPEIPSLHDQQFSQMNESVSQPYTVRGLHFQWNPYMGKLVRTISGYMIDLVLDIRLNSPTFGKIVAYCMPETTDKDFGEWIWVPPGFAHGNVFLEKSKIEYMCTGEYSPGCEAGVSPLAEDIDWSLNEADLANKLKSILQSTRLITEKDKQGFSLQQWKNDANAQNFIYGKL